MDELRSINPNYSKISLGVIANELGSIFPAVRQVDCNLTGVVHHMAVRQNESIRRDDEAGSTPADFASARSSPSLLFDVDVDHGRRDAVGHAHDGAGIFIE